MRIYDASSNFLTCSSTKQTNHFENVKQIIEIDLPESKKNLLDNAQNLEKVAQYCEDIYVNSNANDKTSLYNQTKSYTTQALASVAYQIHMLANGFIQICDDQTSILNELAISLANLNREVVIHKEKLARREIGSISMNKFNGSCHTNPMLKSPVVPEKPIKYARKPIDYTLLDDVGHGMRFKCSQYELLTNNSKTRLMDKRSSYSSSHSSSLSGLNSSMNLEANAHNKLNDLPTPPLMLKSNTLKNITNSAGKASIRSNTSSSYYRMPIIPPSVPSEYLSRQELGIYSSRKEMNLNNTATTTNSDVLSSSLNITMDLYSQI